MMNKFNAKRWAKEIYANEGSIIQQMSTEQVLRYVLERCAGLTRNEQYAAYSKLEDIIHDHSPVLSKAEREAQWTKQ
jgi:hypothetical protein